MNKKLVITLLMLGVFLQSGAPCKADGSAREGEKKVKNLPEPRMEGTISVEDAIAKRRSVRSFLDKALSDAELSQILWAAQGITDKRRGFRAAPSAGATYPLETYVVTRKGVFHYLPEKHALEEVRRGDFRKELAQAALGQGFIREAPAVIVFTTMPERTTRRYGNRGNMYIHMEAGHAAENVHLQAIALGLASVPVGAFVDREVESVIGSSKGETAIYLIPVGREKK